MNSVSDLFAVKEKAVKPVSDSYKLSDYEFIAHRETGTVTFKITVNLQELLEKGKVTKGGVGSEQYGSINAFAVDASGRKLPVRLAGNIFVPKLDK